MLYLHCDGGSRGNPGPAAIGIIIKDEKGTILEQRKEFIGTTTNNEAEYAALIKGLQLSKNHGTTIMVCMDSELVIRQLRKEYKVKARHLKQLFEKAQQEAATFKSVQFKEVPREENAEADKLVNEALDNAQARKATKPL